MHYQESNTYKKEKKINKKKTCRQVNLKNLRVLPISNPVFSSLRKTYKMHCSCGI